MRLQLGLGVNSAGEYVGSPIWKSNLCWHIQDPWCETSLVEELGEHPSWVGIPTGEHKNKNKNGVIELV